MSYFALMTWKTVFQKMEKFVIKKSNGAYIWSVKLARKNNLYFSVINKF